MVASLARQGCAVIVQGGSEIIVLFINEIKFQENVCLFDSGFSQKGWQ